MQGPQINVGDGPLYVSYLGNHSIIKDTLYVANSFTDTVSVIDPATATVKNIRVGASPRVVVTQSPSRVCVHS